MSKIEEIKMFLFEVLYFNDAMHEGQLLNDSVNRAHGHLDAFDKTSEERTPDAFFKASTEADLFQEAAIDMIRIMLKHDFITEEQFNDYLRKINEFGKALQLAK